MGKATRWFRGLLGLRTSADSSQSQKQSSRKKWSFAKSRKEKADLLQEPRNGVVNVGDEATEHAIAVAAATAAAAEAAVAAAQAAAAVVQLTTSGRNITVAVGIGDDDQVGTVAGCVTGSEAGYRNRDDGAAVTIQSHFRAYLSRRALRALKALVRLQALVRGHLVRKQTAYVLRRLQALVRAQVRARAGRVLVCESPHSIKSSHFHYSGPATPEKFDHVLGSRSLKQEHLAMLKRNGSKSSRSSNNAPEKSHASYIYTDNRVGKRTCEQRSFTSPLTTDNPQTDKVLEIDNGEPQVAPGCKNLLYSNLTQGSDLNCASFSTSKDSTARRPVPSQCGTPQSFSHPLNLEQDDESAYCTADTSPTFYSASSMGSSKRGAFTPTSSDCSRRCLSSYSEYPNYMAYTESSKAKARSLSAPKLRPQFERSSSMKRYSVHTNGDSRSTQDGSALHANFTNKAYPGSGHLDRLGIHARGDIAGITGGDYH